MRITPVPAVTLRRTDTTLDLSHKGRKRYLEECSQNIYLIGLNESYSPWRIPVLFYFGGLSLFEDLLGVDWFRIDKLHLSPGTIIVIFKNKNRLLLYKPGKSTRCRSGFGPTYIKIGTIQRRLAWPLRKDDTQNREAFQTFAFILINLNK